MSAPPIDEIKDFLPRDFAREFSYFSSSLQAVTLDDKIYLSAEDVLRAHFLLAAFFKDDGRGMSSVGPRSIDLLESAVARQWTEFGGVKKWQSHLEVIATLYFGLAKDHAFHDGNKRTALLCLLYQLQRMHLCPTISEKDLEEFTVQLADNNLLAFKKCQRLVEEHGPDGEIRFIATHLRKNTRQLDRIRHEITYRVLNTILGRHGYYLDDPRHNSISVFVREEPRPKNILYRIIGLNQRKKIGSIGFHGWSKQVSRFDIDKIRRLTNLSDQDGIDWVAFIGQGLPIQALIDRYKEPLRRLAAR